MAKLNIAAYEEIDAEFERSRKAIWMNGVKNAFLGLIVDKAKKCVAAGISKQEFILGFKDFAFDSFDDGVKTSIIEMLQDEDF